MAAQCAADQQSPLMSRLQSSYVVSYSTISITPGSDHSVVEANIYFTEHLADDEFAQVPALLERGVWKVCSHAPHDHERSVHRPDAVAWTGPLLADFITDALVVDTTLAIGDRDWCTSS
jgi:hypothetical protein